MNLLSLFQPKPTVAPLRHADDEYTWLEVGDKRMTGGSAMTFLVAVLLACTALGFILGMTVRGLL